MAEESTLENVLTITQKIANTKSTPLTADTPILSTGIVDSLSLAELIDAVASTCNVKIDVTEIGIDNADTPRQLAEFVESKKS